MNLIKLVWFVQISVNFISFSDSVRRPVLLERSTPVSALAVRVGSWIQCLCLPLCFIVKRVQRSKTKSVVLLKKHAMVVELIPRGFLTISNVIL